MSGTRAGGLRTKETNIAKFGEDYYKRIGSLGGKASGTGGFYANRERAKTVGAIGGSHSRRGYKLVDKRDGILYYRNNITGEIIERQ